jgi:hypothetical protein
MTEIQMTKIKKTTTYRVTLFLNFEHLDFDIVSDFGFRASNFQGFVGFFDFDVSLIIWIMALRFAFFNWNVKEQFTRYRVIKF